MSLATKRRLDLSQTGGDSLTKLATLILRDLKTALDSTSINECGDAALHLLETDPDAVLELAHEKLHSWPYRDVPYCWRRLYEDASLYKVAKVMQSRYETGSDRKRQKKEEECHGKCLDGVQQRETKTQGSKADESSDQLSEIVRILDMGIALSGQPHRSALYQSVLSELQLLVEDSSEESRYKSVEVGNVKDSQHTEFDIVAPLQLVTDHAIAKLPSLAFEEFQQHLDTKSTPLVMTGVLDDWPAMRLWRHPEYLLDKTIGGRRLVPVEIGESYTSQQWTQKIMPFKQYLEDFVLPSEPAEIGYLAQHDLLTQIPALVQDIQTPDYCYSNPPPAPANVSHKAAQLDEPQLNAWLGPKGTRSPLHTDPYSNIFCQVVGYKYIRLYAPEQTPNMYARGIDESGIDMSNTSQVDLTFARKIGPSSDCFPLFAEATYRDTILAPGECLFVPAGWWHYIESLSISFSVSFWWN